MPRTNTPSQLLGELKTLETSLDGCAAVVNGSMAATCGRWEDMPAPPTLHLARLADVATTCAEVENDARRLSSRRGLVDRELRRVVALGRVSDTLARTAALVGDIAAIRRATDSRLLPDDVLADVECLGWTVADVLRDGVRAWSDCDVDLAMAVRDRDGFVEHVNRRLQLPFPAMGALAAEIARLGRHHERIAEDAAALGDEVLFVAGGPHRRGNTIDLRA